MTILDQLEAQVASLSREDFDKFKHWFDEFQADLWDKQIESDSLAGKLDAMAEQARREHAEGRTRPL